MVWESEGEAAGSAFVRAPSRPAHHVLVLRRGVDLCDVGADVGLLGDDVLQAAAATHPTATGNGSAA